MAIILKRIKVKKSKRNEIKDFLFDVKSHLRKRKNEFLTKMEPDYKDLILSEFPNARDKYGKDN
jgi:hypothetical protein